MNFDFRNYIFYPYIYTTAVRGLSLTDVRRKSRKIDRPLSCPCRHTINSEKFEIFCTTMCGCPHLKNPLVRFGQTSIPLTADVFYGQPLDRLQKQNNFFEPKYFLKYALEC